jgi:hypothetical protein
MSGKCASMPTGPPADGLESVKKTHQVAQVGLFPSFHQQSGDIKPLSVLTRLHSNQTPF